MLKAIETVYRGYRFRSRLEARWAVFFDAMCVRWEYEREGFDLGPAGYYLPDFWLPDFKWWFEVKGEWPTDREVAVAQALANGSDSSVFVSVGQPMTSTEVMRGKDHDTDPWAHRILQFEPFAEDSPYDDVCWWVECLDCGALDIGLWGWVRKRQHKEFCRWEAAGRPGGEHSELERAILTARQARFEHGETPLR
jgi:hypothetical protein